MRSARAATAACAALLAAALALSGGSRADPTTPPAIAGLPAPFLGTALIGGGRMVGAVDSYGDVVDVRHLGPPGRAIVQIPSELQSAGTVPPDSGIVARADVGRASLPLWRADAVRQHYLPGTDVLVTVARFGDRLTKVVRLLGGLRAARAGRAWLARSRPLGPGAPGWARRMYERSLLVLRALTDRRTGATIAGARDGWAYVWPRDAAAVALALAAAGHRAEARRIVAFLERLDLGAAARFDPSGAPVDGRAAEGDAYGWVAAAARAVGAPEPPQVGDWRDRADYQEKAAGDYLGNALASTASLEDSRGSSGLGSFEAERRGAVLVRRAGDPDSGLDAAAAWAVRPFPYPALFPAARRTLLRLVASSGRYGITPSEDWPDADPWTAPTAWSAWSLAALGARRAALRLMADLRRAATPLGLLPERVDARTGIPRSTTPLAWSHAFAILALRELW
ncbi:MAG TPA: glycoside hydrolase family 15 protein [Solirubrobacterales bacterium]